MKKKLHAALLALLLVPACTMQEKAPSPCRAFTALENNYSVMTGLPTLALIATDSILFFDKKEHRAVDIPMRNIKFRISLDPETQNVTLWKKLASDRKGLTAFSVILSPKGRILSVSRSAIQARKGGVEEFDPRESDSVETWEGIVAENLTAALRRLEVLYPIDLVDMKAHDMQESAHTGA